MIEFVMERSKAISMPWKINAIAFQLATVWIMILRWNDWALEGEYFEHFKLHFHLHSFVGLINYIQRTWLFRLNHRKSSFNLKKMISLLSFERDNIPQLIFYLLVEGFLDFLLEFQFYRSWSYFITFQFELLSMHGQIGKTAKLLL